MQQHDATKHDATKHDATKHDATKLTGRVIPAPCT